MAGAESELSLYQRTSYERLQFFSVRFLSLRCIYLCPTRTFSPECFCTEEISYG